MRTRERPADMSYRAIRAWRIRRIKAARIKVVARILEDHALTGQYRLENLSPCQILIEGRTPSHLYPNPAATSPQCHNGEGMRACGDIATPYIPVRALRVQCQ